MVDEPSASEPLPSVVIAPESTVEVPAREEHATRRSERPAPGWLGRTGLVLALLVGALLGVLPTLLSFWWESSAIVTLLTAEALERTDGLDPGTFEVSYWFTLLVTGVVLVWCGWRRIRKRPGPMLPLVLLVAIYAVGYVAFVAPDLAGGYDAPDGLTALILVGAAWLWRLVLPGALIYFFGVLVWRALRLGWRDRRAAASVAGLALVFGLGGIQLLLGATVAAVTETRIDEISPFPASPGEVDDELLELRLVAAASVTPSKRRSTPSSSAFNECAETLYRPEPDGQVPMTAAIRRVERYFKRAADAYDIAMDTLVKVCMRHVKEPVRDLVQYFSQAVANTVRTACRVAGRTSPTEPAVLDGGLPERSIACGAGFRQTEAGLDLERGWNRLSVEDRVVMRLFGEGYSFAEIARELDTTEANARQRKKRALERMQAVYAVGH